MTDRFSTLTVVLESDRRDDDAESIINAIKMTRGVLSVKGNVSNSTEYMAQERARSELAKKLWEVIYPKDS